MPTPPIRFVYFDLDDTLLDHRSAERRGLGDVLATYRDHFDGVTLDRLHEVYHGHSVPLWRRYSLSEIDKETLQRHRFAHTLATLEIETLDPDAVNTHYLDCYARYWAFPRAAREAFHTIADRYPVGLLTNGFAEVQRAKLARFPELQDRAQAVIISENVGVMKPHPRLFAHATEQAEVPPEAILYVGDSYTSDVQGAHDAGWQMAWFKQDGHTPDEHERAGDAFCFQAWPALTRWLLDPAG